MAVEERASENGQEGGSPEGVKVGEKVYSAADVQNLVTQTQAQGPKVEAAQAFLSACERYQVTPEDFLTNSEGAFAVMHTLIEKGIVDNQGNLIERQVKGERKVAEGEDKLDLEGLLKEADTSDPKGKTAQFIAGSLGKVNETMSRLMQRLEGIESVQTNMLRGRLSEQVKSRHPELDDEDVSRVLVTAMRDKRKTLWEHAVGAAEGKRRQMAGAREAFAKEFGVDLARHDENKLMQQDPSKGFATRFKGKKFSFKKGKDSVAPSDALRELMSANEGE